MSAEIIPDAVEEPVTVLAETAEETTVETDTEATPEKLAAVEVEAEVAQKPPMSVAEFKRVKDEFGAGIAAETFAAGGDYASALKLAYDATKAELDSAKARLSEESTAAGGDGIPARSVSTNGKSLLALCETGTSKGK